jgi:hypothetical protein
MSEIIKDNQTGAFVEDKCCIEHEGHKFCSGGSWLGIRKDTGKMEGILYATNTPYEGNSVITSWDGSLKIRAVYGREWRDNFGGLNQSVYFRYNDRYFYGRWAGKDRSDIVRCREITEKSYFGR